MVLLVTREGEGEGEGGGGEEEGEERGSLVILVLAYESIFIGPRFRKLYFEMILSILL